MCNKVELIRLMVFAIASTSILTLHIKAMIDGILSLKTEKKIVQKNVLFVLLRDAY